MAVKKRIVLNLEEELRARGITRYELAKRMGTHFQTIDNYYKNKVIRYDSDILLRICVALDCDIGDIIKII
jgi:putative transcriptional regulator